MQELIAPNSCLILVLEWHALAPTVDREAQGQGFEQLVLCRSSEFS